jgi:hypothetical protein
LNFAVGVSSDEAHFQMNEDRPYTGDEALGTVDFRVSCAEETQPNFDRALGFLHHMMYVEAQTAFERIVKNDPHARTEDKAQCLAEGMNGFLGKPINMQQLYSVIEEHLSSSSVANS